DGHVARLANFRRKCRDDRFRDLTGIQPVGLGVAERTVSLEIAVLRLGRADFRPKIAEFQAADGEIFQLFAEKIADVEGNLHPFTQRAPPAPAQAWNWNLLAGEDLAREAILRMCKNVSTRQPRFVLVKLFVLASSPALFPYQTHP